MDCPVCSEPMIVLEHESVEVDHCVVCGGIWLDAGELELLLDSPNARQEILARSQTLGETAEKHRRCPICRRKMEKAKTADSAAVVYDLCPQGDGLWLDRGELEQILDAGTDPNQAERVRGWLHSIFRQQKD